MPISTLEAIRTKVRRITRTPSISQLSNEELDQYINTFLVYNLPEKLRLFSLRTMLTFYTQPYVDTYETNTTVATDPLYNFKNKYTAVHNPVYIAGVPGCYTQYENVFYAQWPKTNWVYDTGLRGTGGTGPFAGVISSRPVLQRSLNFSCLDAAGAAMILTDSPQTNILGNLIVPNNTAVVYGTINYVTGAFTLIFPAATQANAIIYAEGISYKASKPVSILFYDNKFVFRPVPDKVYTVQIEADVTPTELLAINQDPFLNKAWEYISLGASKKIFEDRLDYDSVNLILPTINEAESLLLRSTLMQAANQATVTLYTTGKIYGAGWPYTGWPY